MPSTTEQMLVVLRSIDATLKRMASAQESPTIADAADLDGQYGDPTLKLMPKAWKGDNYKGRRFSECPPELLDQVASLLDWLAQKADENDERTSSDKPVAPFKRRDAARARGWAKRLRDGWTPPPMNIERDPLLDSDDPDVDPFGVNDDVPF